MKPALTIASLAALLALAGCEKAPEPLPVLGQIPAFTLTASSAQPFSSAALAGKIWIADFIFTTCPGPCPRMSAQMKQVEKAIAAMPDVAIVSFTVDPEHDTPGVLADYAKRYAADTSRWHFLTGPMALLDSLAWDAFHLNHVDGHLEHSTRFTIVDGQGRIRQYVATEDGDPVPAVIEAVNRLRQES